LPKLAASALATRPLFGRTGAWSRRANFMEPTPNMEQSFAAKIATFANPSTEVSNLSESAPLSAGRHADSREPRNGPQSGIIEKSVLSFSEPRRLRDQATLN